MHFQKIRLQKIHLQKIHKKYTLEKCTLTNFLPELDRSKKIIVDHFYPNFLTSLPLPLQPKFMTQKIKVWKLLDIALRKHMPSRGGLQTLCNGPV